MSVRPVDLGSLLAGIAEAPALAFRGLCVNSRQVAKGEGFVALQGIREHGLVHAARAAEAGAAEGSRRQHEVL